MEIYAWGANSHGQLGVGTYSEIELPQIVPAPSNLAAAGHSAGAGHTILLTFEGDLWVSGWNSKGQLGNGTTEDRNKFTKLNCRQKFISTAAGWDSSAGITTDNRLFVWGSNHYNQLGFSKEKHEIIPYPTELSLPNDETPISVSFGLRTMSVLTSTNKIYIAGSLKHFKNSKHQTINHNSTEFMVISPSGKIHHIANGQNHIIFDSDRNSICGIGDNKFMQCDEIHSNEKIIQLSCGWKMNGFLTDTKSLYLYGRNNYGQLGNGSRIDCALPQLCHINPVEKFELGAEHGILLSKNDIYTWGWNEHGISGNGSVDDILKPEKLNFMDNREKLSIIAGSSFCMVLCRQE